MIIGEYFVKNNYITKETLDKALEIQSQDESLRLGEILVTMRAISEKELNKFITNFVDEKRKAILNEVEEWLTQKQVDDVFSKFRSE